MVVPRLERWADGPADLASLPDPAMLITVADSDQRYRASGIFKRLAYLPTAA
jgi:hypothetical protein